MTAYAAPLADMKFVLTHLVGLDRMAKLAGRETVTQELLDLVLDGSARFAAERLAPLNWTGDRQGAKLSDGKVTTAEGFRDAYRDYADAGWIGLSLSEEIGGQNLPLPLYAATFEMVESANLAFSLCPMLSQAAIEALVAHASPELQAMFLPRLVTGEWTGTMNLTEPQAGSDLAAIRTKAERRDGHYRLFGQKIYITWGEHDVADNILHMVLARTPDAPPGVKGISLFAVPKYLVNPDGSLGARNDVFAVSLEHKLGIHASPTAVMSYGDGEGAFGYLVGEENRGLEYMFTMMNAARLAVGLQGVAVAERAYQQARDYAKSRVQGKTITGEANAAIIRHPDVRRMLLTMRALTEASRALAYTAYLSLNEAHSLHDSQAQARIDLLVPVVKAWSTDIASKVASLGIQVHGGMGFIEETGVAQHYRDARILAIYEGTNGIQANDLAFRKVLRDRGAAAGALIAEMTRDAAALAERRGDDLAAIRKALDAGIAALERATAWIVETGAGDLYAVAAGAASYLKLFGIVAGGWMMAKSAMAAADDRDAPFSKAKLATARFYAETILVGAPVLVGAITEAQHGLRAAEDEWF
jgi:alkylation response protein AidB-like acyl-CoA dehydrogenase